MQNRAANGYDREKKWVKAVTRLANNKKSYIKNDES